MYLIKKEIYRGKCPYRREGPMMDEPEEYIVTYMASSKKQVWKQTGRLPLRMRSLMGRQLVLGIRLCWSVVVLSDIRLTTPVRVHRRWTTTGRTTGSNTRARLSSEELAYSMPTRETPASTKTKLHTDKIAVRRSGRKRKSSTPPPRNMIERGDGASFHQ